MSRRSRRVSTRLRESTARIPGEVVLHRLNRVEYASAIRDLLGVEVDASRLLPPDVSSDGFDNVAEVLRVSPTYLDQYIAAAREISIKAVGNPAPAAARAEYLIEDQEPHRARRRFAARHARRLWSSSTTSRPTVNTSSTCSVSSEPGAELRAYPQGWLEYEHTAILTIDGAKVFEGQLGGEEDLRDVDHFQIAAVNAIKDRFRDDPPAGASRVPRGRRDVHRAQLRGVRSPAADLHSRRGDSGRARRCSAWRWSDRTSPTGISEPTQTRERIFICYPETEAEEELPCAERILTRLARLAFRRPVTDADMEPPARVLSRRPRVRTASRRAFRKACSRSCRARSSCIAAEPERAAGTSSSPAKRTRSRISSSRRASRSSCGAKGPTRSCSS